MQRLLIADGSGIVAPMVVKELSDEFLIQVSHDGNSTMERLFSFDPDILFLDSTLDGIDSYTILHTLRATGRSVAVILLSNLTDQLTMSRLKALDVSYVMLKPCALTSILTNIRDLAFRTRYPDVKDWCVENELDTILMLLNFRSGPIRNKIIRSAVRYRYENPDSSYIKEVCPAIAKQWGGNPAQVEKAMRDAVRGAFAKGNKNLWQMYFPPGEGGIPRCPGSDEFITRIAYCLVQRARIKPPFEPEKQEVK